MEKRAAAGDPPEGTDWRYQSLLEVTDLLALHPRLDALLPDLGHCLQKVVHFDALGVVLPRDEGASAQLYTVLPPSPGGEPSAATVEVLPLRPIHETQLAEFWARQEPVVLHSLDAEEGNREIVSSMRARGKRSLCLVPLTTPLHPVGLIVFASSRTGAYDQADLVFLSRVASQVAIAIENVRHYEEAQAYQRQLEAERDNWRTLLEINNAIVTNLDLASLLAAITPNIRRMVSHDYTNLALLREGKVGAYAIDPDLPAGIAELVPSVDPAAESPFHAAVGLRTPIEGDPTQLAWLPELLRKQAEAANVKRLCVVPLVTSRRLLGGLSLARRAAEPFTRQEQDLAVQAAGQIAIALENALAFREIASLKDRLARENVYLEDEIRGSQNFEEIIGESRALQRVLAQVRSVAPTDTAVLLLGETGTGKELVARAIHSASERRARPLVTVNCATSPAGLLESEWFGHEKGAFTGALNQKTGRFELANQGTLFLDEIGDVPLDLQAKLLRVLQEHEIERLGSTRTIRVDFRLVAATNRNLQEMVASREYRSDLYYRLNVFPIRIPPLRERREDIPPLVRYFVQRYAKRLRRTIDSVARESMDALCRWHWPGNVRELQNVIERAVILSQGPTLKVALSEFEVEAHSAPAGEVLTLEDAEREHILRALQETRWVIGGPAGAAARLGLKRTTLVSTMRRLGIARPDPSAG